MSSSTPSPVFPAPAGGSNAINAPFSARLISNEMGSIRLGGSGRPLPIARRFLHPDNATSNENARQDNGTASASPEALIGRRLEHSVRISMDSIVSDNSSERFRVRRIMPRRSSASLGAASRAIQPVSRTARSSRMDNDDTADSTNQWPERSREQSLERASTRPQVSNRTISVNKPSSDEDGRRGQAAKPRDTSNSTALTASSELIPAINVGAVPVRKRNLPQTALSSARGERRQPPVRTSTGSAPGMESGLSVPVDVQSITQASPTRDYSKLPPELLKHYTHHIKHDTAQRPSVSFVSRVDATGARSPIAPWRLLDDRIDHIYEDPSIDMVQLNLFHPFTTNDKERKLAERERLVRAAFELRQRGLEQKRQNDVLKERKDRIQQMSQAIRSRNRQVAMANRTQTPSPAREAPATSVQRREDAVLKRKPPVPRLSGNSKKTKRRLSKNTVSDDPTSTSLSTPEAFKIASGSESGNDTVQPSVTGSILLGDHAFSNMAHPDVTQSVLVHTDEEASERDIKRPALSQSRRIGRGKARVRKKNHQLKDTDTVASRPETLQRRALAREFMILQKRSRQYEREKLKQQNEIEQEKRRRQMEELERRRLHNLRQAVRQKKTKLTKEESKILSHAQNDESPADHLKPDVEFPTASDDLQTDPLDISDTENDRRHANVAELASSRSKSTSDIDKSPERTIEEDPVVVDARLRKLLDLEEKAKSLMAKLNGLAKRKNPVSELAPSIERNFAEKRFEIEELVFESTAQDDSVADSEQNDDEDDSDELTSSVIQAYGHRSNEQEPGRGEQDDENDDDDSTTFRSTHLDIFQADGYDFANRMNRSSSYGIEARPFEEGIGPELDPRTIGVYQIGVEYSREELVDEERESDKSDEIRHTRSDSVASSLDSSDHSTDFPKRTQSSRNRTLEESLEQYMTRLVHNGSSHQSRAGSRSSAGNLHSDEESLTMGKVEFTADIAYTQQVMVRRARVEMHDDRLRQLFLQEDDSLSVIHSTALKLLTANKEQRRLKLERERIEAEDVETLCQQEKDRQLETLMASILGQVESEHGDDTENDHTSEQIIIDEYPETGNASFITLEKIMEAVERERRQEREQEEKREEKYDAHDQDNFAQDQYEVPQIFWDDMLEASELLGHKNPRVAIDTTELILQRHQQEDEADGRMDEQTRLLHSPQSLAKRLLAEVELHDAIHEAHLQISLMEHSQAIEQAQRETIMMASAFKEEMENNFSAHQIALQHATLEKKFDSDLQDVMQKLQDVHEAEKRENQNAAMETERALKQARLQESGAQTEPLTQVDAATYAPLRIDTGTATSVYVDAGIQWDCSDDEANPTANKATPFDASEQSEYEQSVSNTEAAATAISEEYDDEVFESEAEKAVELKQAYSVETVVDAEEDEIKEDELSGNDSIPYSETQNSHSHVSTDDLGLNSHDYVAEIESQHSQEDADIQSDNISIVSESEDVRSGYEDDFISSQHEEMQDEVQREHTQGEAETDYEHVSVVSGSQMDHESYSVESERESNDKAVSMSYDDNFEAPSPRTKQMPRETVDEPEESDIIDYDTNAHESESEVNDEIEAVESEHYCDDHSNSLLKSEIANKNGNVAEANSQKQTGSFLLDRNQATLRTEETHPRIMLWEPNGASNEAQLYVKDLEVRRQTEESLLQYRLHALEIRLRHELEQLENSGGGSGTHWVGEMTLRREALNMNFLAEKANVESLKAANMARYYQDLLAFQALTTYERAAATSATPASFVLSPRMILVNHPSSNVDPLPNASPLVKFQPEEPSVQVSDPYPDDDFASEDGNENASHVPSDGESNAKENTSILSEGASIIRERIVSDHEEDHIVSDHGEEDIDSEQEYLSDDFAEDASVKKDLSDDIKSDHEGNEVEDVVPPDVDDPEEAASAITEEENYAEDDFASVSGADAFIEPQKVAEEAVNVVMSADVDTSLIDNGDDEQAAEDGDIEIGFSQAELDASITEAEFPDEAFNADGVNASAEDYGDEIFESEASQSAVNSDQSKRSIASDDVASSVEMDVGSKQDVEENEGAEIDLITHETEISGLQDGDDGPISDHQEVNDIERDHTQGEIESDEAADDTAPTFEVRSVGEDAIASEASRNSVAGVGDAYSEEDFESVSAIEGRVVSTVIEDEESDLVYEDEFESSDLETGNADNSLESTGAETRGEDDYAAYSDEEFEAGSDIGSGIELASKMDNVDAVAETPLDSRRELELQHPTTENAESDGMISIEGAKGLLDDKPGDVELSQDLSTVISHYEDKHSELSEANAGSIQVVSLSGSDSEEILTKSIENHLKRLEEIEQQILERRREMKLIEKQKKVERRREDLCNKERELCEEMERVETQLRQEQAYLEVARQRNRLETEHLATKQQKLAGKSWQPDLLFAFDYVEAVVLKDQVSVVTQVSTPDCDPMAQIVEFIDPQDAIADTPDVEKVESTSFDLLKEFSHIENAESVDIEDIDTLRSSFIEDRNGYSTAKSSTIVMNLTDVDSEKEEQSKLVGAKEIPVRTQPSLSFSCSGDLLASFDYIEDAEEPIQVSSQDLLAHFDFVEDAEMFEPDFLLKAGTEVGNSSQNHKVNSKYDHKSEESNGLERKANLLDGVSEELYFVCESEHNDSHESEEQFCASTEATPVDESISSSGHVVTETNTDAKDHDSEMRSQQADRITELIYHDLLATVEEDLRIQQYPIKSVTLEKTEMFIAGYQKYKVADCRSADEVSNYESKGNFKHANESETEEGSMPTTVQQTVNRDDAYVRIADSLFKNVYEEILASGNLGRHQAQKQGQTDSRSPAPMETAIEIPTMMKRTMDCALAILQELALTEDGQIHLPTRAKTFSHDTLSVMVYDVVTELLENSFESQAGGSIEKCRSNMLQEIESLLMVQRRGQDDLEHQIRRVLSAEGEAHGDDCEEGEVEEAHLKAQIRSNVSTAAHIMERKLLLPPALLSLPTKGSQLHGPRKTAAMTTAITQELESLHDRISNAIFKDFVTKL